MSEDTEPKLTVQDLESAPIYEVPEYFEPQGRDGKWFAVNETRQIELAPVFDCEVTAEEVGRKCAGNEAFFNRIPTVAYGTPFPRPRDVKATPFRTAREAAEARIRQSQSRVRGRVVSSRPLG